MSDLSVGVDVGGTKVRVGICHRDGSIQNKLVKATAEPESIVSQIGELLQESGLDSDQLVGVGIGSAGPLDLKRGLVVDPVNISGWGTVPLRSMVHEAFGVPTYMDNDANAAALAERMHGVGSDDLIYITISTGIGGGIIANGSLVHGGGSAGEIGHMTLVPSGPLCNCGKRGCLEALASGTAIAKRGRELMNLDGGAEEVFEEARTGNNVAKMIIDNAACYLGLAIANLTELLHPEDVVLGGGVTSSWALLEERVRSALDTHRRVEVNLTLTSLGPHNGLLGAGMLPFHHRSQ